MWSHFVQEHVGVWSVFLCGHVGVVIVSAGTCQNLCRKIYGERDQ